MPIEHPIHPDDHPELAVQYYNAWDEKDGVSDLEVTLLTVCSLVGFGILAALGALEVPVAENVVQPIIANTNIMP